MINCFDSWLKPYIMSVHLNNMNEMNDSSTSLIDNKYTYTRHSMHNIKVISNISNVHMHVLQLFKEMSVFPSFSIQNLSYFRREVVE